MKRSERILMHARREALLAGMWFSVASAAGAWAVVGWMNGKGPGGALLGFCAIAVSRLCLWHAGEARRLGSLGRQERTYERPMVIRAEVSPRECRSGRVLWIALAVAMGVPAIAAVLVIWKFQH